MTEAYGEPASGDTLESARTVHALSVQTWGGRQPTTLIGRHPSFQVALDRVARIAAADMPVLITGETGTGKELFARALFLLARERRRSFLSVNCAQYLNDQMLASELFGHKRGSFTGAVSDHAGVFEAAEQGFVFLDEVGELSLSAQAMLLRAISEGEILPVGSTRPKRVNVRVVAATNRDLGVLTKRGKFRPDLYFRLHRMSVNVPALRERGDDWELIARHHLGCLGRRHGVAKTLSPEAAGWLRAYAWPGNVRELIGCVETGYYVSDGDAISHADLEEALEGCAREEAAPTPGGGGWSARDACDHMAAGDSNFWELIYEPFMARDINRQQVREVIAEGLTRSLGGYKRLLTLFGVEPRDYLKFMDFLRHHRLKPKYPAARQNC
jgi:transcriptional regulator with GAF, ATPase, and Fis domain